MKRLWFLSLLLLLGYTILAWQFPLIPYVERLPLSDIRTFAPTLNGGLAYAALVCMLYGGYLLGYQWVRQSAQPPRARSVLATGALFGVPLILTYPVNAVDVFRYFFHGRMFIHHGASPLAVPPNALPDDPYLPFAAILFDKTSPYGPLWELVSGLIYLLTEALCSTVGALWASCSDGAHLLSGIILFKLAGLLFHLAAGVVIWRLLANQSPRERVARLLLWTWNPTLLLMFVIDAHNDILMLLWLLLGLWCMRRGQLVWGMLLMVLAPLTKPIGLLLLPIFAVAAWQEKRWRAERVRALALSTVGSLMLTMLVFLPFGSPLPLLERLVDEARGGISFSPVAFIFWLGHQVGHDLPFYPLTRSASNLMMVAALVLVWATWRGRTPLRGAADMFGAYLLTGLKFRIWYPTWLFPWLVLDVQSRFRLSFGIWLLLTSQLSVIIYGHIRVAWLGGSNVVAHLVGVPFVFGIPLLMAFLTSRRAGKQSSLKFFERIWQVDRPSATPGFLLPSSHKDRVHSGD
jgi:hypothetical protein